jgi:hypothetical protein
MVMKPRARHQNRIELLQGTLDLLILQDPPIGSAARLRRLAGDPQQLDGCVPGRHRVALPCAAPPREAELGALRRSHARHPLAATGERVMKFWPRRTDAVDDEIRGHIEMAVQDRMERASRAPAPKLRFAASSATSWS